MINLRAQTIITTGIILSGLIIGCGRLDEIPGGSKKSEKSQLELTPTEQLVGTWSGIFRVIDNTLPQQSGETVPADLILSSGGEFKFQLTSAENSMVLGHWTEFQGKNLLLAIDGSTVPRVGSAGKMSELGYSLVGSSLHIFSSNFEAKLTRKIETGSADSGSGLKTSWMCKGPGSRETEIVINGSTKFEIRSHKKGEKLIISRGNVSEDTLHELKFSPTYVTRTNPTIRLFVINPNVSPATMTVTTEDNREVPFGLCH